jgi:hypothetical protein
MRYAVVKDNLVVNIIEWDGQSEWSPPEGASAHQFDGAASPGWTWNDGVPVDPSPPVVAVEPSAEEKLAASGLSVAELRQLLGIDP